MGLESDRLKNQKNAMEYMKTGKCPFKGKQGCPEELLDLPLETDQICTKCIKLYFMKQQSYGAGSQRGKKGD